MRRDHEAHRAAAATALAKALQAAQARRALCAALDEDERRRPLADGE